MEDAIAVLIGLGVIVAVCYLCIKALGWFFRILTRLFGAVAPLVGGILPGVVTYAITQELLGQGTSSSTLSGFLTTVIIGLFIKRADANGS